MFMLRPFLFGVTEVVFIVLLPLPSLVPVLLGRPRAHGRGIAERCKCQAN